MIDLAVCYDFCFDGGLGISGDAGVCTVSHVVHLPGRPQSLQAAVATWQPAARLVKVKKV